MRGGRVEVKVKSDCTKCVVKGREGLKNGMFVINQLRLYLTTLVKK